MTTHDHPSDEAKPLEASSLRDGSASDENARPLDTDRTGGRGRGSAQRSTDTAFSFLPRPLQFVHPRLARDLRRHRSVLSKVALACVGRGVPARGLPDETTTATWVLSASSPLADSGCTTGYTNAEPARCSRVHRRHQGRVLGQFHGNEFAGPARSTTRRAHDGPTVGHGNYPWGYYQFHHHFIAHDAGPGGRDDAFLSTSVSRDTHRDDRCTMPSAMRRLRVGDSGRMDADGYLFHWPPPAHSRGPSQACSPSRGWSMVGHAAQLGGGVGPALAPPLGRCPVVYLTRRLRILPVQECRPRVRGALASRTLARGHAFAIVARSSASSSCARRTSRAPTWRRRRASITTH